MIHTYDFLKMVLDSVTEHIVVIDRSGAIRFVNRGWIKFGSKIAALSVMTGAELIILMSATGLLLWEKS